MEDEDEDRDEDGDEDGDEDNENEDNQEVDGPEINVNVDPASPFIEVTAALKASANNGVKAVIKRISNEDISVVQEGDDGDPRSDKRARQ